MHVKLTDKQINKIAQLISQPNQWKFDKNIGVHHHDIIIQSGQILICNINTNYSHDHNRRLLALDLYYNVKQKAYEESEMFKQDQEEVNNAIEKIKLYHYEKNRGT